jgi:hypothetical protein
MDNSECLSVKSVKIYPEMTSQYYFFLNMVLVDYIVVFLYRGIYSDKPLSKYYNHV